MHVHSISWVRNYFSERSKFSCRTAKREEGARENRAHGRQTCTHTSASTPLTHEEERDSTRHFFPVLFGLAYILVMCRLSYCLCVFALCILFSIFLFGVQWGVREGITEEIIKEGKICRAFVREVTTIIKLALHYID